MQAVEARLKVVTFALILIIVVAAALVLSGTLYLRMRRIRLENDSLKAAVGTFAPSSDHVPGGEAGTEMETVLRDMVSLVGEMNEACGRNGDGSTSTVDIRKMLDRYFPEKEVAVRIRRICDLLYPGVLSSIGSEYPSLTDNDILLIALMACRFPTGAICAIRRLNVHSLNVQKTRTARKIAPGLRLSDYVADKFPEK